MLFDYLIKMVKELAYIQTISKIICMRILEYHTDIMIKSQSKQFYRKRHFYCDAGSGFRKSDYRALKSS